MPSHSGNSERAGKENLQKKGEGIFNMPNKKIESIIHADGVNISVVTTVGNEDDYISLTDMARHRNPEFPADVVKNWLRLRSTIEFLGLWETLNNSDFKLVEFDQFKQEAGSNQVTRSIKMPPLSRTQERRVENPPTTIGRSLPIYNSRLHPERQEKL